MKNIKDVKPNNNSIFKQGYFIPANPDKYIGDITKIIYRSSWEYKFMVLCDLTSIVVKWSSEPVCIDYYSPLDEKYHKYFVDFYCSILDEDGVEFKYLIEIKPKNQAVLEMKDPKTFKSKQKYMEHLKTIIINRAKWQAAEQYAKNLGWQFKVWTEDNLNIS